MNKLLKTGAWLILVLMFLTYCWYFYLLFYPVKTLEIYDQPLKVLTHQVRAGDKLVFHVRYCKFINKPGSVIRVLIPADDNIFTGNPPVTIPSQTSNIPPSCQERDASVTIPSGTAPGMYYLKATTIYDVNAVRTNVTIDWRTENFEVIK